MAPKLGLTIIKGYSQMARATLGKSIDVSLSATKKAAGQYDKLSY